MTREEAISHIKDVICENNTIKPNIAVFGQEKEALYMAIKALEAEPLTDTEQRIFLAAMGREEKVCKEVCDDGDGIDLVAVCHSIERKVKKSLWE